MCPFIILSASKFGEVTVHSEEKRAVACVRRASHHGRRDDTLPNAHGYVR
jgi:hypothetical protein